MDDLDQTSKELLATAAGIIKKSGTLPTAGDEFDYYTNFPGYRTFCCRLGSRINKLIGRVVQCEELHVKWPTVDRDALANSESIDEQFDSLVEVNDILLEKTSNFLDNATSKSKGTPLSTDTPTTSDQSLDEKTPVASWNKRGKEAIKVIPQWRSNVPRPQAMFKDMIDNSDTPFIPMIREKPNALRPLPSVYTELQRPSTLQALIENARKWAESPDRLLHPYQYELEVFEPIQEQFEIREPQEYKPLDDTPLVMINTIEGLKQLLEDLKSTQEIAIDLEAHSYRSFQGFVCLMQLSTRTSDYIVDTLELREHMYCLNEVFTDPKIIKVMHGADWDIPWLQRDFGLYIVNLFDTGQASRVLQLPRYSLAFLLNYCCEVQADKQYQLADWRIRPLPADMIKYAREDTHYLLYVYDRLRNELIRRSSTHSSLVQVVINNSRDICLKKYEKQLYNKDDYLKLYKKFKRPLGPNQIYCLKLLYKWRLDLAREEDESTGYVLPNHMLFQLAEILPREVEGVVACCTPTPTLLRQQVQEVHRLIQSARNATPDTVLPSTTASTADQPVESVDTTVVMATSTSDSTSTVATAVGIIGPPVDTKSVTIDFENKTVPLSEPVNDIFTRLREGFKQMLSVLIGQKSCDQQINTSVISSLQYKKPSDTCLHININAATPISQGATPTKATPTPSDTPTSITPALPKKRKALKSPEEVVKKPRLETEPDVDTSEGSRQATILDDEEEELSTRKIKRKKSKKEIPVDLKPFDYESVTFSSAVAQDITPLESFDPFKSTSQRSKVPRSNVKKGRPSQKSVTFKRKRSK